MFRAPLNFIGNLHRIAGVDLTKVPEGTMLSCSVCCDTLLFVCLRLYAFNYVYMFV